MMNASKESARKALEISQRIADHRTTTTEECEFVAAFLGAAIRKLPSEAAYKADKKRRRQKSK